MRTMLLWLTILGLLALLALPAVAQRGAPHGEGRPNPPKARAFGKVVRVDARQRLMDLSIMVNTHNPNAPGKVPDEFARKAASLSSMADRLEKNGDKDKARRLRQMVAEMLSWREVEHTIRADQGVPLIGVERSPLSEVAKGDRLRVQVSVEGNIEAGVPVSASLERDAVKVGEQVRPFARRLPKVGRNENVFFDLVGDVVQANPLVLSVNGKEVQIKTDAGKSLIHRVPVTMRDLRPGQSLLVYADIDRNLTVRKVERLVVVFGNDGSFGAMMSMDGIDGI